MSETATQPWLEGVRGTQVHPIINLDDDTIRVEAGPGTGKTFGLVRRVQRILHPQGLNVPGDEVLVVAFNRVIAKQLQQEIDERLNTSVHDGKPVIRTIHALCLETFGGRLRIALPHEQEAMIYDVLCNHPELREKYKTQPKAEQALREHEAKHRQHMQLWQAVQQWLRRHHAWLISDLPNLLLDRIKGGDFADQAYRHVIVDEFQDLTPGEQQLLLKLRREGGTFMAPGDPRQSIYAFRGNDPEGLSKLDELFAPLSNAVADVSMTECHRCPPEIVEAANQLMGLYEADRMVLGSGTPANTHVVVWSSLTDEAKGMANAIAANIQAHSRDRHLVMVTRRKFGYSLREQIHQVDPNLKVELGFSEGILETWPVREAFLYFCLLADPDASTWRAWLGYQNPTDGGTFKAPQRNADAYLKFLTKCKDQITEVEVEQLAHLDRQPPGTGGRKLWERAKRFVELKGDLQWDGGDVLALLNEVFDTRRWGCDQSDAPETARLDMERILSLALDIYQEFQLEDPEFGIDQQLREVAGKLRHQIATREPFAADEPSTLLVTTLWGAKGITADHVYVIGVFKEAIPGTRHKDYPGTDEEHFEEQRRLFYVTITRSKKTLVLSRARRIGRGEAAQLGLVTTGNSSLHDLEMSPYLQDITEYLPDYKEGEDWGGCV